MAKKKKEVCPYCGNSFAYLSRHKCKVKERLESPEDSDKSEVDRRIERIEERKKHFTRNLKKEERKDFHGCVFVYRFISVMDVVKLTDYLSGGDSGEFVDLRGILFGDHTLKEIAEYCIKNSNSQLIKF